MLKPRIAMLAPRLAPLPPRSKRAGHRITGRSLQTLRGRIWLRDSGICGECGKLTIPPDFELDHRRPLDAGGDHSDGNLQVLHVDCHKLKTARELANG
jgi:5-methylcytosine-specific restriction protein A